MVEFVDDAIQGVENRRKTLDTLVEQGLRARLDLASLITGQLYVELNMFPGSKQRRFPNNTDYHQIPSVPSLQSGLQQSISDLIANQPKLSKGINQVLELLNFMTADGGAEKLAQGAQLAGPAWPTVLADPNGPLRQTLDQLPGLTSDLRQSVAAVPGLVTRRIRRWRRSMAWSAARTRPWRSR